jgi:hypothetical protein
MSRFVPRWQRMQMAKEAVRRKAMPLPAQQLSVVVAALGELADTAAKRSYLRLLVDDGKLTHAQGAYAARVAGIGSIGGEA